MGIVGINHSYIKEQKTRHDIFVTFLVVIIIFLTDTVLFATNSSQIFGLIRRFGVVLLAIALFIKYTYRHGSFIRRDIITLFAIGSIAVSMILAGRLFNGFSYITQMSCLLFALSFSYECSQEEFVERYLKIMRIIAIVSLFAFLLGDFIVKINLVPTIVNSNGKVFKTLFFTNVPATSFSRRRNWGPFWEPGVYQAYLNIALYFTLFFKKENILFDSMLYIIVALTTLSGAALIPMVLIVGAYFFEKKNAKSIIITTLIGVVIVALVYSGKYDEIIIKLISGTSDSSFSYRYVSLVANLKAFIYHPFFGAAPEYQDALRGQMLHSIIGTRAVGTTNTFITYFSYYGVFVGSFITYRTWYFVRSRVKSILAAFLVFAAIIATTSNENLTASLLISVLPFLMTDEKKNNILSKRRKGNGK